MRLEDIGNAIREVQKGGTVAVVTDSHVAPLYLEQALQSLRDAGFQAASFILPAGEESKNGTEYLRLMNHLAEVPLTRSDGIAALGGGMVGDLAGFAAATYLRGIPVYQIPTTLLACVDSSVGGKSGIDLPAGKNLVGAFHQPALVLKDVSLLRSLPEAIFREGCAEVLKYGMIEDEAFFRELSDPAWLKENLDAVVDRCIRIKTRYVEEDEFDHGSRQLLNFGHTIGHAVELLSDYALLHGEAVAKGMMRITKIAVRNGFCEAGADEALERVLTAYGFDLSIPYEAGELLRAIEKDKKRRGNRIRLAVPERIGRCVIREMSLEEFGRLL